MERTIAGVVWGALAALSSSTGCVVEAGSAFATPAGGVVVVSGPPPDADGEARPGPPDTQAVWIAGYWHWSGMQYAWIPGHWERAAARRALARAAVHHPRRHVLLRARRLVAVRRAALARRVAAAAFAAALAHALAPGRASARDEPLVHEPIPPDPEDDLVLRVSLDGDLPAAIHTPAGIIGAPDPLRPPAPSEAAYAASEVRSSFTPDTDTRRPQINRVRRPVHALDGAVQAARGVRRRAQRLPRGGARPAPGAARGDPQRRAARRGGGRVLRGPRRRRSAGGERPHPERGTGRADPARAARRRLARRSPSASSATARTTGSSSRRGAPAASSPAR